MGSWNGRLFAICPLTHQVASMFFPSPDLTSFHHWETLLTERVTEPEAGENQEITSFVERIISSYSKMDSNLDSSDNNDSSQWTNLKQLKGNYLEKKATYMPTHWLMLKDW